MTPLCSEEVAHNAGEALSIRFRESLRVTAYRVLDVREDVSIGARVGTQVSFAFVETRPNPFLSTLPVVVRGQDYIFAQGDQALVSTLLAAEDDYERSEDVLIDFVRSLGVPE